MKSGCPEHKSFNICKTGQDRVKVAIDCLSAYTVYRSVTTFMTLNDL